MLQRVTLKSRVLTWPCLLGGPNFVMVSTVILTLGLLKLSMAFKVLSLLIAQPRTPLTVVKSLSS